MLTSMADYVAVVSGDLDPSLVCPSALDRVRTIARSLPPMSFAGFECRLGAADPRVDLQLNLTRFRMRIPPHLLANPVWDFIDRLTAQWVEPRSDLMNHLGGVFLEFDLVPPLNTVPVPSLFFSLRQGLASAEIVLDSLKTHFWSAGEVADIRSNLETELSSLPPGSELANLGVMLGRSPAVFRARVTGLRPCDIAPHLHVDIHNTQKGWIDALALAERVDAVTVLVDVTRKGNPTTGLELFYFSQHPDEKRWRKLLERLVELGACAEDKADALLQWPGAVSLPRDRWPNAIGWGDRLLAGRAVSLFWRRVNHIKVTPESHGTVSAKAYLAFGHSWIDRRAAESIIETTVRTTSRQTA